MHITIELYSLDYRNKPSQDTFCIVDKHIFTNKNKGGTQHVERLLFFYTHHSV